MKAKRMLTVVALAVSSGLLGCNGGYDDEGLSDRESARQAAVYYLAGLRDGRARKACDSRPDLPRASCIEMTRKELRSSNAFWDSFARGVEVEVEGDSACAVLETGETLALSRYEDYWTIDAPADALRSEC